MDLRPNRIEKVEVKNDFLKLNRSITLDAFPKYNHDQSLMRKHFCQIVGPDLCHVCKGIKDRNKLTNQNEQAKAKKEFNGMSDSLETKSLPIVSYNLVESEVLEPKSNYKLMALILKNKYAITLDENEIERMLMTGIINSEDFDRSQMFIADGLMQKSELLVDKLGDTKACDENKKTNKNLTSIPTIFDNIEELKKFKVTEYFFTNLTNLKSKLDTKRTGKLLISETVVPNTSNKMFLQLERFETNQKYIQNATKRRSSIFDIDRYNLMPKNNNFEKLEFLSSRKFHIATSNNPKYFEPTVLNLKAQRINKLYDRRNNVLTKIEYKKDFSFIQRKMPKQ